MNQGRGKKTPPLTLYTEESIIRYDALMKEAEDLPDEVKNARVFNEKGELTKNEYAKKI